jgi:cytochrome d ubiquinol oxidase subunit II
MDLPTIWFILVAILIIGYAILDGFDLGVGILHLFIIGDTERRLAMNAIGPVWDGNVVWLVTGGGALFAAFPEVYASAFSGLYTALMLLLTALILRAVSMEFRSKHASRRWRSGWDTAFASGSLGAALLIGVAFGNVAEGMPMDGHHTITIGLLGLLNPYALLVGITTVVLFAMHGAIYLVLKTQGALQQRIRSWVPSLIIAFIACYLLTTAASLIWKGHLVARMERQPWWFCVPIAALLAIANVPREIAHGRDLRAFGSSSVAIALLVALIGIGLYPTLLLASPDAGNSLTIANAASSPATLRTMLVIAIIGMPLVISYTAAIYWIFRGKVTLERMSY